MKKVLFLAMMALALVACEEKSNGGGGGGSSDGGSSSGGNSATSAALAAATADIVTQIGSDEATVEKNLLAAGYTKMKGQFSAPARMMPKKALKAQAESDEVMIEFAYNVPENYNEMTEEEGMAWLNKTLKSNTQIIFLELTFVDDMLRASSSNFITGIHSGISKLYTSTSDELYKELSSEAKQNWHGIIVDAEAMNNESFEEEGSMKQFTDHAEFVAAINAGKELVAEETAQNITSMTEEEIVGFFYAAGWVYPDENMQKEMMEESGLEVPYAYGSFNVADINYQGEK